MSRTVCANCAAETTNGSVLCRRCITTAKVALENITAYHGDLLGLGRQTVRARRAPGAVADPTGEAVARRTAAERSAGDQAAADARATLAAWAGILRTRRGRLREPEATVRDLARFLEQNLAVIASQEWAGWLLTETQRLEIRMRRLIERSRGRWYAGICSAEIEPARDHNEHSCLCSCHHQIPCDCDLPGGCGREWAVIPATHCDRDLYSAPGETYVRCPSCGTAWLLHERRYVMLEAARELLLPLPEIARVAVMLTDDEPSTRRLVARLNKQVQRGQLQHRAVHVIDGRSVRHYRLGDVTDTLGVSERRTSA